MSAAWSAAVREIPLLVWLAAMVAVAWTRHRIVGWMRPDARSPGNELPPPPDPRHTGYVVNLTTGAYRKIRCDG